MLNYKVSILYSIIHVCCLIHWLYNHYSASFIARRILSLWYFFTAIIPEGRQKTESVCSSKCAIRNIDLSFRDWVWGFEWDFYFTIARLTIFSHNNKMQNSPVTREKNVKGRIEAFSRLYYNSYCRFILFISHTTFRYLKSTIQHS